MGKGRSAPSAPTEQTVVQSNLPKYVQPYFERLIQRAESESKRDYEPYQGQRLADESQELLDSRQRVRDLANAGLGVDKAMDAASAGIGRAMNLLIIALKCLRMQVLWKDICHHICKMLLMCRKKEPD